MTSANQEYIPFLIFGLSGTLLFVTGVMGAVLQKHFIRKIISINISSAGIFLFLVATAKRNAAVVSGPEGSAILIPDPVPHAMVLTGIVVALATTAFAVALYRQLLRVNSDTSNSSVKPSLDTGKFL